MITPIKIDNKNLPEELTEINLSKDIVFVTPENVDILKFNSDGRISITSDTEVNISTLRFDKYQDIRKFKKKLKLKISYPAGIYPQFINPMGNPYLRSYPKINSFDGITIKEPFHSDLRKIDIISTAPSYIIYNEINLNIVMDLKFIRDENPTQVINDKIPIADILLTNVFCTKKTAKQERLFYIKDDYIYEDFINQLSGDDK